MKYMCMICYDEKKVDELSEEEYRALVREALAYDDVLRAGGHYVTSAPLQSIRTATTLRPSKGKVSITDGPFAEAREHLGGFIIIEAADLNQAIELASKIPPARLGCVEVRPVKDLAGQR